mmetsp:Transcript_52767/g.87412  ORF Transcript_52767/g.87412 Transcript_52767/m.87412 type:complete len:213 (+) Transcript_52767:498-1136(+)
MRKFVHHLQMSLNLRLIAHIKRASQFPKRIASALCHMLHQHIKGSTKRVLLRIQRHRVKRRTKRNRGETIKRHTPQNITDINGNVFGAQFVQHTQRRRGGLHATAKHIILEITQRKHATANLAMKSPVQIIRHKNGVAIVTKQIAEFLVLRGAFPKFLKLSGENPFAELWRVQEDLVQVGHGQSDNLIITNQRRQLVMHIVVVLLEKWDVSE